MRIFMNHLQQSSKFFAHNTVHGILMAEIYPFAKLFLPTTFNSAIRQTLTLPNIPIIRFLDYWLNYIFTEN